MLYCPFVEREIGNVIQRAITLTFCVEALQVSAVVPQLFGGDQETEEAIRGHLVVARSKRPSSVRETNLLVDGWGLGESANEYLTIGEVVHSRTARSVKDLKALGGMEEDAIGEEADPRQLRIEKGQLKPFTRKPVAAAVVHEQESVTSGTPSSTQQQATPTQQQQQQLSAAEQRAKRMAEQAEIEATLGPSRAVKRVKLGLAKPRLPEE